MDMPKHLAEALVDGQTYADFEKLHAVFTELRTSAPVALAKPDGIEPFWFISKFDDLQFVEKDNSLFHAGDKSTIMITEEELKIVMEETGGPNRFITLVQMDGEKHAAYRELTQSWFGPRSLRELEPRIRERTKDAVASMLAKDNACDFATDIALYYPLRVIMDILGVENEAEDMMLRLTQEVFGATDPEANATGREYTSIEERMAAMNSVIMESMAYFTALTESRRKEPKNDLASVFANGKINGEPLGDIETYGYYAITATAGHDTTSNSTTAGMWALCQNPDLLAQLKEDPSLIPAFVEESIRWESPVKHFMRTPVRDVQIRGVDIKANDWMMINFACASRDEEIYENPFEFDIHRKPNRHMALGYGAHVCLGQHLARMEMRMFWEELLPHLTHVEMAGPIKRVAANFVSGPHSLPINFKTQ
ncbi:MAG: cytochrome P450 [Hyphomicrobiales bacterium]|nr:MAG: cytochrome P450 [Hyphomicrobiales bacterium]